MVYKGKNPRVQKAVVVASLLPAKSIVLPPIVEITANNLDLVRRVLDWHIEKMTNPNEKPIRDRHRDIIHKINLRLLDYDQEVRDASWRN